MRRQDELTTPLFNNILHGRPFAHLTPLHAGPFVRVAAVATILVLVFGAFLFFSHRSRPQVSGSNDKDRQENAVQQVTPTEPTSNRTEKDPIKPLRRVAYKRGRKPQQQFDLLISRWRSPTGFLLQAPADELLKTVPRLVDPRLRLNAIIPSEKN